MGFVYWSSSAPNTFSVALTTGRSFTARINGIQVTNHGGRNPQSPIRLLWFGFGRQPASPAQPALVVCPPYYSDGGRSTSRRCSRQSAEFDKRNSRHIIKWNEGTYLLLISASPRFAMSLARSASYRVCAAACLSILPNLLGSPDRMISDRDSRE